METFSKAGYMIKIKLLVPMLFMLSTAMTHSDEYKKGFFVKGEVGKIFAQKFTTTQDAGYIDGSVSNYALYGFNAGYKINSKLSASLGLQYRRFKYNATLDSQNVRQSINNYFALLSGYYNIVTNTAFTPYLTIGFGCTYNNPGSLESVDQKAPATNFTAPNQNSIALAWNIGFGSKVALSKNVDLDLTYRYMDLGKVKVKSTTNEMESILNNASQNLKGHQITLGIIYNF